MKTLLVTLAVLSSQLLTTPAAAECEENGCRNRPSATADTVAKPQTRALKKKPKKECQGSLACERTATADSDAKPQTRALKKKPKKEACEENTCN